MTSMRQHLPLALLHRQVEHTDNDKDTSETSRSIFIGINVTIVVVLLICILGYCYLFRNRFDAIIRHQIELNENTMAQNIRDRQFEQDRAHAAARERNRDRSNHQNNDFNEANNDATGNEDEESSENRRALLEASFLRNKVTMVVSADDYNNESSDHYAITDDEKEDAAALDLGSDHTIHVESTSADKSKSSQQKNRIDSLEEGELRYLWVGGGMNDPSSSLQPQRRRVPNCCAICLGPYEVNEKVVWSVNCSKNAANSNGVNDNTGCKHAFHYDCMIDWLIKVQEGTPCPCCRQEFTDLPLLPPRSKLLTARQQLVQQQREERLRNFDLGVFTFR